MLAQVIDLFHDGWSEIKKCFCSAKLVQKVIGLVVYWFLTTSDLDFSDDIIFEEIEGTRFEHDFSFDGVIVDLNRFFLFQMLVLSFFSLQIIRFSIV